MFNEKDRAENLLRSGFEKTLPLTRSIFLLAKYYKYLNYDMSEANLNIDNWLKKQVLHVSYNKAISQKDGIVKTVYNGDHDFFDNIKVDIYLHEMIHLNKLKNKSDKIIFFCLLYLSKIYSKEDGVFYATYKILAKISNKHKIRSLYNVIDRLEESEHIKVVQRNKLRKSISFGGSQKVYKYPNKYKILTKDVRNENDLIVVGTLGDCKDHLEYEFKKIYLKCIREYKLKTKKVYLKYLLSHNEDKK